MKYTREQYEAFYYLNKLLPYLNTCEDCDYKFNRINRIMPNGLLVSIPKEEKEETRKKLYLQIVAALAKYGQVYTKLKPSKQQNNITYLARVLHLNQKEEIIVRFLSVAYNNEILREYLDCFSHKVMYEEDALTSVAGLPKGTGCTLLKREAPLTRLGLIEKRGYVSDYRLTEWALEFINTLHQDDKARYKCLIGEHIAQNNEFSSQDFKYIEAADLALKLMKQAKYTKGFNILLYGIPGTGKTCFAKFLAHASKLKLYTVGENNEGAIERNYRLQQLYRKQFLLKKIKNTCILFDEAEDVFSSIHTLVNKVELNRMLENNERPVIWTTNKIYDMDPAFIRRFTLAVCFSKPPKEVREKIWNKYLSQNKIVCSKTEVANFAQKYDVPPSMIESAARVAHMAKGNLDTVKTHISLMRQALNGGYKKAEKPKDLNRVENFSPELIHADMDLNILTEQLKGLGRLNFSLCLYGASGTGKSAYARYLAEQLGLEVIYQRASDLMSMFVGGTEKRIAAAFARAKETKSMLIFDEADSFLRDRSNAMRSWEVSGVNEMLTWMESHPYPFICTTNLMNTLDPASLRRFSFKVKYDFLTSIQVQAAFKYFFGLSVPKADIIGLDKLTPGDFTLVKNKAEILGTTSQFAAIKEMLEKEQKLKHNACGNGIGFRVN